MGVPCSSLERSYGGSKEVRRCIGGTDHLRPDGCGPWNRRGEDTGLTKSPKSARTEDVPGYRQTRTGWESHGGVSEQPFIGDPFRMSWGDASSLKTFSRVLHICRSSYALYPIIALTIIC